LALLALLCIAVISGCRWVSGRSDDGNQEELPDDREPREIVALGRLRPLGGVVAVSAIPGERLATLAVGENSVIPEPNRSLGTLASHELREIELAGLIAERKAAEEKQAAELAVAKARVQQATVALAQANTKLTEVDLKRGDVKLLEAQLQMAEADLAKLKELAANDPELVTETEFERKSLEFRRLEADVTEAQESLKLAQRTSELAVDAASADVEAARAVVQQVETSTAATVLEQQIAAAKLQKQWAELPAPCRGTVLKIFVEPGEFISRTPILQIADLTEMGCVAEVYEADVKTIGPGDDVILQSQAFRGDFADRGIRGEVQRIGKLIGPPGMRSLDPMARTDRHVVEVLIRIDPKDAKATAEAARLIDLQVTVKFPRPGGGPDAAGVSAGRRTSDRAGGEEAVFRVGESMRRAGTP
jgi:ABC exporter DevB family membrane fusion protein